VVPPTETSSYAAEAGTSWVPSASIGRVPTWGRGSHAAGFGRWLVDRSCRMLNIVVAIALLVLGFPVMLLIAVAVRLSSPGPAIFKQQRVGLDRRGPSRGGGADRRRADEGGRVFEIYKFRTMYVAQADDGGQVWAEPDDFRVTPLGRLLRSFRLDEVPQLWNVLKGDMNIVGPRPEQPRIFHELRGKLDHYPNRQRVLPGITGLAQVSQGYDQTVEDVRRKLGFDLEYIERRSPLEDLRIMAKTAPVMILRKGAR